jgi:hypothetical protein
LVSASGRGRFTGAAFFGAAAFGAATFCAAALGAAGFDAAAFGAFFTSFFERGAAFFAGAARFLALFAGLAAFRAVLAAGRFPAEALRAPRLRAAPAWRLVEVARRLTAARGELRLGLFPAFFAMTV